MSDPAAIRPFKIEVSDAALADLRDRLARTRWPDQIADAGWDYGSELASVRALCDYWRDGFDWRAQEAALNRWPQFTTDVDGERLHFIHAKSKHADAFPLLITHGWPGSVVEFQKILPLLTDPTVHGGREQDAFHVICPSMPGYGFSGPTHSRGWDPERIARAEIEIMHRLGYVKYGAQGGDWGAIVTPWVARLDPRHCAGIHLNMLLVTPPPDAKPAALSDAEQQRLAYSNEFNAQGTGYQAIQGTKPQTLAYGLTDSPAGLAGWILEKFRAWGDCPGGDVLRAFTRDELLTNISVYWFTATINSSTRLYYEQRKSGRLAIMDGKLATPTGCAVFPKELYNAPRAWAELSYNITHWSTFESGGHFAALERPNEMAADLRTFFATVR